MDYSYQVTCSWLRSVQYKKVWIGICHHDISLYIIRWSGDNNRDYCSPVYFHKSIAVITQITCAIQNIRVYQSCPNDVLMLYKGFDSTRTDLPVQPVDQFYVGTVLAICDYYRRTLAKRKPWGSWLLHLWNNWIWFGIILVCLRYYEM